MTYDLIETSTFNGQPVELFEFSRGASFWRYTNSEEDVVSFGATYESATIQRSKIEQTQDLGKSVIMINMPRILDFVQQYIQSPPSDIVSLTIRRFHSTDPDISNPANTVVIWIGRVVNIRFEEDTVIARCEPVLTSLRRGALRRVYQTTCPHVLYGSVCRANRNNFRLTTDVESFTATTLSATAIDAQPDGYYTGGFIQWSVGSNVNKRFIIGHTGDTITLNLGLTGLDVGTTVEIFPGCDHRLTTCVNKFNNELNYGGFPYIPIKNPFSGTPIF